MWAMGSSNGAVSGQEVSQLNFACLNRFISHYIVKGETESVD